MRIRNILLLTLIAAALAGCGGGGGGSTGGGAPTTGPSQGTAAGGIALGFATISVKCQDASAYTTTASVSGAFSVTIAASAYPCLLQAAQGATALRSVALGTGVVNITPLTDLLVARLGGMPAGDYFTAFPAGTTPIALTHANVASAQTAVRAALSDVANLSVIPDLITTPFTAATATSAGDNVDKALDAVNAGLATKGLSAYNVMAAFARGADAATIKSLVSSGNADSLANIPFSKQWAQGRQRSGAGGVRLARIDGNLHSFGYGGSYGAGWMVSSDNGSSWQQRFAPITPQLIISFNGRLTIAGNSYSYVSSLDGGQTWGTAKRFPGLPLAYDNSVNGADCFVLVSGKLFAKSALSDIPQHADVPIWVSADGATFQAASASEKFALDANQTQLGWRCNGVIPGLGNLIDGYDPTAVGSKYFRESYTAIPGANINTGSGRFYDYHLEISADKVEWSPVSVTTNWVSSYIAELAPSRFIVVGTRENDKQFRAIGGTYLSVDGGTTWTDVGRGPATTQAILASAAIDTAIVAVGEDGLITRSADGGTTWTNVATSTANNLASVTAGSNIFVAVGNQGTILRSTDLGVTWTQQSSGTTEALGAVAYGSGKFVVVASSGLVLTSTDGARWASSGVGLTGFGPLQSRLQVAYGGGAFVASAAGAVCVGSNCSTGRSGVFYTQDGGATWGQGALSDAYGVAYGNGYFLAQKNATSGNTVISTDLGRTWVLKGHGTATYGRISYGNGVFASADGAGVSASLDGGITWKFYAVPGGAGDYLTFTGSRWVGVGQRNTVAISSP